MTSQICTYRHVWNVTLNFAFLSQTRDNLQLLTKVPFLLSRYRVGHTIVGLDFSSNSSKAMCHLMAGYIQVR